MAMNPKEMIGHLKFRMDIKHKHITIMNMVAEQTPLIGRRQFSYRQILYIRNTLLKKKKLKYF